MIKCNRCVYTETDNKNEGKSCPRCQEGTLEFPFVPLPADIVKEPEHYKSGVMEVIDVIEAFNLTFHLGNVIKYILRHEKKGGVEDLKKAARYLSRVIAKMEGRGGWE